MGVERNLRNDPGFWLLVLVSFGLRGGLLALYPDLPGRGDEALHYVEGVLTAALGQSVIARWPPGYEAFLAMIYTVGEARPVVAKAVQVLLSTATVALTYAMALRAGGRRVAIVAGALAAAHPGLVAYSHYLYSETLFVFLLTAAVHVLHRSPENPPWRDLLLAGVLFGLATLTRSVVLYFFPLWMAWAWLRGRRPEALRAGLLFAMALGVVLPWTARNAVHHGGFMLVDPTGGRTAYLAFSDDLFNRDLGFIPTGPGHITRPRCGATLLADRPVLPAAERLTLEFPPEAEAFTQNAGGLKNVIGIARLEARTDFIEIQTCEIGNALEYAREKPGTVASHVLQRLYAFWGPNSFLLRYVHEGVYPGGPLARENYRALTMLVVLFHVIVLGAALLALGRPGLPPLAHWVVLFVTYYTGIHVVAVAYSRYRLPLLPLLLVVGALWLAKPQLPSGYTRAGRARIASVTVALLGFLALCLHYLVTYLP